MNCGLVFEQLNAQAIKKPWINMYTIKKQTINRYNIIILDVSYGIVPDRQVWIARFSSCAAMLAIVNNLLTFLPTLLTVIRGKV